jgi:DNA invertase Pin-like site-specific DNA recombinase
MKVAIYARVSTDEQELDHQIESCKRFCEYRQFEIGGIFAEKISGMKNSRPQLDKMLKLLRERILDGVVVFRVDRLGRRARDLIMLLEEFQNKDIKVYSINENLESTTAIGRAMVDLICIFSGLEREQISESTKQRLQSLKASGKRLGQKPASEFQVQKIRELAETGLSCRKIANQMNISHVTVYNIVNQKGYYSANTEKIEI